MLSYVIFTTLILELSTSSHGLLHLLELLVLLSTELHDEEREMVKRSEKSRKWTVSYFSQESKSRMNFHTNTSWHDD